MASPEPLTYEQMQAQVQEHHDIAERALRICQTLRKENDRLRTERDEWHAIAQERSKELQKLSDKIAKVKRGEGL